jgi:dihydrofolate reductase
MKTVTGKPLAIIVAIAENQAIGLGNQLLWHLSDDLKRFKRITAGHPVIMGRRTYQSLPLRPLRDRRNIVISDLPGETIQGCQMAYSIEDAVRLADPDKENFVIGGGMIYRQFMPLADRLYITWVHKAFEADTFFPLIDPAIWKIVNEEPGPADAENDFSYTYRIYERRLPE